MRKSQMTKLNTINGLLDKKGFMVTKLNNETDTDIQFEVLDLFDKQIKQARILKWQGSYEGSLQLQAKDDLLFVHHCTL